MEDFFKKTLHFLIFLPVLIIELGFLNKAVRDYSYQKLSSPSKEIAMVLGEKTKIERFIISPQIVEALLIFLISFLFISFLFCFFKRDN